MTDIERLEKFTVMAFKQHWRKIVRDIEGGRKNYINECYQYFEADTVRRQKILAGRFYGTKHAREMASLNEKRIKENLSCYLSKAIAYALKEYEYEPEEQKAFMKALVSCEYVVFRSNQCNPIELFNENEEDVWVSEYPARVAYDDWYEASIGAGNTCMTTIIMKSTGEGFTKSEIEWLKKSIQKNIDENDHSALWWFECEPIEENKIWVKIYDYEIDRPLYMEDFLNELERLNKEQLNEFIREILNYLHKEYKGERIIEKLNVFNRYKSMEQKKLYKIICDFFWKNWEKKLLSDFDIRAVEDIMNTISGRNDRNYHTGINF